MGNCLLGSDRRVAKAQKLAETSVQEYEVRHEVAHQKLCNAIRVRQQLVAENLKSVPKSQRMEFVKTSQSAGAKRIREAHAAVRQAEGELKSATGLLNVARNMLRTAQIQVQANAAQKMAVEFAGLLPRVDMDSVTKNIDNLAEQHDEMHGLQGEMEAAIGTLDDHEADEEDWLNGDASFQMDEDEDVQAAEPLDRKVSVGSGPSKLSAEQRANRQQPFELLA